MSKTKLLDKPFVHKMLGTDPNLPNEMQPKEVLSYSFAGFGQNLICSLVMSFFLFFLTDGVRMDPLWLAWMFLGARLFDAFNDPIMGTIVDRTRTKDGKMRPYLKGTPIPIAIMTILLFLPYNKIIPNQAGAFALATIIYLIWGICYTVVDVPYWGLASSMTKDTDKRNTMLTVARLFCTIGAGIVTVLLPMVQGFVETADINNILETINAANIPGFVMPDNLSKDMIMCMTDLPEGLLGTINQNVPQLIEIEGASKFVLTKEYFEILNASWEKSYKLLYGIAAVVIALASIPSFYIGFRNTKERYYDENSGKAGLIHNVKLLGKNRPIVLLILVGVLGCLRTIYMTSGIYYAKYNCGEVGLFSTMTLLVVPGGLIATLTTPVLSRKFGKRNLFLYSHLVGGIAMLIVYFVGITSYGSSMPAKVLFFITLVLLGVPSGFANILQYSMIADSIDYLEDKTGERAEGICFSMQTFISKIGMAFSSFTTLLVIGAAGYASGNIVDAGPEMKSKIWMASTLLAAVSIIASCIPLFFYNFTEKKQAEAVARISERKKAKKHALAVLCTAEGMLNDSDREDKNMLLDSITSARTSLDKVFKIEDIDAIMNDVKAKDDEFFDSIYVREETDEENTINDNANVEDIKADEVVENAVEAADATEDVTNNDVEDIDSENKEDTK